MSIAIQQRQKLADIIQEAIEKANESQALSLEEVPEVQLEVPRDKSHGDFASNIAMVLAKPAKMPPRKVAETIVANLGNQDFIEKVEIAGPGFINFFLSNGWLHQVLKTVYREGQNYGMSDHGKGEKVLLEFVSANPVGPMNVVNARAAAVGDTLARMLRKVGYQVATEYYVNDAGNQAEIFGRSIEVRYRQLAGEDVSFPEDCYPGEYVTELASRLRIEKPDLLELDEQERLAFCKRWGTDQMVELQKADLAAYGVIFDTWFRERELHAKGALEKIIALFKEKGYMYTKEDALWFHSSKFGDDKDRVIIKSDGSYTYVTADIAYHYDKLLRGFTTLIDILGPDHHGYIGRMKAAVQALGYPAGALEVMILQYVSLLRDGKQVKMSKRAGEFITMQDLLEEVGKDAARYFFLMRSPESHLDFDMTLAVEESNENPVFYIQYAHARIASIFRQAAEAGVTIPNPEHAPLDSLQQDVELDLIKKLAEFPEDLLYAAVNREPHRLARYALDLAAIFHSFYSHCHVLGEEESIRDARLALVNCVQIVLKQALDLLGVSAPDKM